LLGSGSFVGSESLGVVSLGSAGAGAAGAAAGAAADAGAAGAAFGSLGGSAGLTTTGLRAGFGRRGRFTGSAASEAAGGGDADGDAAIGAAAADGTTGTLAAGGAGAMLEGSAAVVAPEALPPEAVALARAFAARVRMKTNTPAAMTSASPSGTRMRAARPRLGFTISESSGPGASGASDGRDDAAASTRNDGPVGICGNAAGGADDGCGTAWGGA
jgi:hypothetical protein